MSQPMQITITLDGQESYALRSIATRELRKPKDQARYLLRQALGLDHEHTNQNAESAGNTASTPSGALST